MIESKGSDSGVSYWNFADPSSRLTFEERSSALGILTGHEAAATETFHAGDRQRLAGTWPRLRLRCRHVPRCEADALPSALGLGRLGEGLQKGQSHRLVMGIKYDLSRRSRKCSPGSSSACSAGTCTQGESPLPGNRPVFTVLRARAQSPARHASHEHPPEHLPHLPPAPHPTSPGASPGRSDQNPAFGTPRRNPLGVCLGAPLRAEAVALIPRGVREAGEGGGLCLYHELLLLSRVSSPSCSRARGASGARLPSRRTARVPRPRTARAGLREASVEQPGAPPSRVGLLLRNEPAHQVEAIPVSEAGSEGPVRGVGSRVIVGAQPRALTRHLHPLGRGSSRRFMPPGSSGAQPSPPRPPSGKDVVRLLHGESHTPNQQNLLCGLT